MSWPIRNRDGLLAALHADKSIVQAQPRAIDSDDPEALQLESFLLLDRPEAGARPDLAREDLPVVEGELLLDKSIAFLEAVDDGRLDRLIDRFATIAGPNIPPAHPRTKIIGNLPRHELALAVRTIVPVGLPTDDDVRLRREQSAYIISEIWTKTPHPLLRRRTPLQAAAAGDSETFLRASIRRMEGAYDSPEEVMDWNELRGKLHVSPEPAIDPETVEFDGLHLSRVPLVPIDRLDDERLVALYRFSVKWGLRRVRNRVSRLLDERPSLLASSQIEVMKLYGDLALEAAQEDEREQAEAWLEKGKQADSRQKRRAKRSRGS